MPKGRRMLQELSMLNWVKLALSLIMGVRIIIRVGVVR